MINLLNLQKINNNLWTLFCFYFIHLADIENAENMVEINMFLKACNVILIHDFSLSILINRHSTLHIILHN